MTSNGKQGRFPFDQKFRNFRNGDKWYGNFLRKVPENPEIVEFPKSEPFNRKFWKFRDENQWNGNFQENMFENLGVPHVVVLFFGNYANSQFSIQR